MYMHGTQLVVACVLMWHIQTVCAVLGGTPLVVGKIRTCTPVGTTYTGNCDSNIASGYWHSYSDCCVVAYMGWHNNVYDSLANYGELMGQWPTNYVQCYNCYDTYCGTPTSNVYYTTENSCATAACASCATGSYSSTLCTKTTAGVCTACKTCAEGEYSQVRCTGVSAGTCATCGTCGPGTYPSTSCIGTSAGSCQTCSIGSFFRTTRNRTTGAFGCYYCNAGGYASARGSSECTLCPTGSFSTGYGGQSLTACTTCTVGTYSQAGQPCTTCPSGTYTDHTGSGACTTCRPGNYGSATSCTPCPIGTASAPHSHETQTNY